MPGDDALPIRQWHIVISGFMQTEGTLNGMALLWRKLDLRMQRSDVRVEMRHWNDNWNDFAEFIWRLRPDNNGVKIYVYAYSWGGGYGLTQLARHLMDRGLGVRVAVLSDAVYCDPLFFMRWLAMVKGKFFLSPPKIGIPGNVQEVFWFRQYANLPSGHDLRQEWAGTLIHDCTEIETGRIHQYMDDLPEFHSRALEVAQEAYDHVG